MELTVEETIKEIFNKMQPAFEEKENNNPDKVLKCYEISPSLLKNQVRFINPFERVLKEFSNWCNKNIAFKNLIFTKEYYEKLVKHYIYKNQFKKFGTTFAIDEDDFYFEEEYRNGHSMNVTYFKKLFGRQK